MFFYVLWKHGGLGLLSVGNGLDVRWAFQVYKYLTSKDTKVVIICARHLKDTLVASKGVKNASFGDILAFLNSQGRAPQGRALTSGHYLAWCTVASIVLEHCCVMWREMRLSFADYDFTIKGRLNLLLVKTVLKRTKQLRGSIHCDSRHCRLQPETVAYVLNHCHGYMGMIRSRHGRS